MIHVNKQWLADVRDLQKHLPKKRQKTIERLCNHEIGRLEHALAVHHRLRNTYKLWTKDDLKLLKQMLDDAPICKTWEDEKAILNALEEKFAKRGKNIRKKAIAVFGDSYKEKMDYGPYYIKHVWQDPLNAR